MLQRLLRAIGVREGEDGRLARLAALIFSLSAALVIGKAAQNGIFLSVYPRTEIPLAFMYSAGVLAISSFVMSALAERFGPVRLTMGLLVVCMALFVGGWVLLVETRHRVAPLILYVAIEAMTGVLLIQGWAVVTEAVDVRSAKRLLPLVGNGASIAWAAGGFGTSALVRAVGTEQLLLLAPALLVVAMVLVKAVERIDLGGRPARGSRRASLASSARAGLGYVATEPLMRVLAVVAVLSLLIEQVLDFQLMAAAKERYATVPDGITAFMGVFYGVTGAITVVAQLALSGRFLSRLGSPRAVLVSPSLVALASAAFVVAPSFALAAVMRGVDRVLKQALGSPALEQIHIPVPPVRRVQARALVKGVLAPAFYALGAAALRLLPPHVPLRWVSFATIGLATASVIFVASWLQRAYVAALRRAVDQRRLDLVDGSAQRPALDRDQVAALLAEVRSGEPKRASFAIDLLARGDPLVARPILHEALEHKEATVRAAAVEALARFGKAEDARTVAGVLQRTEDDVVERACLRALGALGTQGLGVARGVVESRTKDANPEVRALAWASLARAGEDDAAAAVAELLRSPDEHERAAAAWATGEMMLRRTQVLDAFTDLLSDPAPSVRSAAIRSTGKLQHERFVRAVAWALSDHKAAAAAVEAVSQWSDNLVDRLDDALRGAPTRAMARATAALAHNQGPHGDAMLSRLLLSEEPVVRYRATRALSARRRSRPREGGRPLPATEFDAPPRATLLAALRKELHFGYGYYALLIGIARNDGIEDYEIEPEFAFLGSELQARIRRVERRVLALLGLVADPRIVHAAELRLRSSSPTVAAQAVELLDNALDPELARLIVPFFERKPLRMRLDGVPEDFDLPGTFTEDPLRGIMQLRDPHLRRCAMWTYKERFAREFPTELQGEENLLPLVERIYFLRGVPLFAELSGEDLRQIAEIVEEVDFEKGDVVFRKGDPGEALFLVVRGRVLARDGAIEISHIGPREFFGDLAVLDHEPRSADVVCLEDTQLLRIAAADLEELMERRTEIGAGIIKVLARRLRAATARIGH